MIASRAQPFNLCLFVDALDEHEGKHTELLSVLKQLNVLAELPSFHLRIVVASRPENIFRDRLGESLGFTIHKHTSKDIRKYVHGRFQDESKMILSESCQIGLQSLKDTLIA